VEVDPLGEPAAVGMAQLRGDDAGGSFSAAIAEANACRSMCGWAASPTLEARRAKARLWASSDQDRGLR
jgi:hypothetical protein